MDQVVFSLIIELNLKCFSDLHIINLESSFLEVSLSMDSTQRGACDRCRGQKLRCVGLSGLMPTFESKGRLQRNEKPCDRCRKAQVECYSVRPASRRQSSISSSRLEEKSGPGAKGLGRKKATKYHDILCIIHLRKTIRPRQ